MSKQLESITRKKSVIENLIVNNFEGEKQNSPLHKNRRAERLGINTSAY